MPSTSRIRPARRRRGLLATIAAAASLLACALTLGARPAHAPPDDDVYTSDVLPLLERYCFRCHGEEKQKAGIRFDQLDPDMLAGPDAHVWPIALDVLGAGDMPPGRADQPTAEERRTLTTWIRASLEAAARAQEGERRPVLRRLNAAQYTYALRELLGVDIDFGRALPGDAKSELGFTNDGAVLRASPLHLEYYQAIAREALDKAIAVGERPEPTRYRVTFGEGVGVGHPGATTGGYQAVPLDPDHFRVEILDAEGRPKLGASEAEQAALDRVKHKITVGLRGSSQDRFHVVPEGLILYSALPHKEVAPGAWQGPSPNVKLEMQRVFPEEGDFVLRVEASRGYLVTGRKELLVALDAPAPRASVVPREAGAEPSSADLLAMEPTVLGEWHRAGPFRAATGESARDTEYAPLSSFDFDAPLADGTRWEPAGDTDGAVQMYASEIGAVLLARIIEAPTARTMDVSLGSDDALFVWLNGEEVLAADVQRGVAPDQDRLELELRPGRNELLLKVVNHGGGFGSYFRVLHDGTSAGRAPYDVLAEARARVLSAERASERANLRFEAGGLVAEDFPAESRARLALDCAPGYYQFDLVHRALPADAMGSIRFAVGELKLDLRPRPTPEELAAGFRVTPIGAGYLNGGAHELTLGGPFFVGFSHLVMTPLASDHPLVRRLETQAEAEVLADAPALRAYIGTRTDDGMDYATFDAPRTVDAPLGAPEVYELHGRLEDLPIPEPESGDDEILSGICVLGLWNDHLVKSPRETGPPLLVRAIEVEAPWHPVWPQASHTRIFLDSPHRSDEERYTREVLAAFLPRAFRRLVGEEELERYLGFWRAVREEHEVYEHGVREVLVAALSSPSFLFLVEPEDARDADGRITETALASRLAFFLWLSPPDEELLRLADEERLREELHAQVERLLDDRRAERFVRTFAAEWLRLDRLEQITINPNRFPDFTRFVKRDMAEETVRFLAHVLREDLSLATLIDADFALLNQNLAEFYGVEGVRGVEFRPVAVGPERGGLLAQGAFLAGHSDGNEPHPIKRAVWVKAKLLGQPPPAPPPNVPELDPAEPGAETLTLKQRIERHRDSASCFDCHAGFDPFGIALETYDAVGRPRAAAAVDARTVLPDGTELDGAQALKAWLRTDAYELLAASVAEHLYAFALGRTPGYADEEELRAIRDAARARGDTLRALVHAVVASRSFRDG